MSFQTLWNRLGRCKPIEQQLESGYTSLYLRRKEVKVVVFNDESVLVIWHGKDGDWHGLKQAHAVYREKSHTIDLNKTDFKVLTVASTPYEVLAKLA